MHALAIDFETANDDRASPCAIGLAWISDGSIVRREYRLIRPKELRFGYYQARVHGLHAEDVVDAPEFPDVIAEFLPEIEGSLLLAHNAAFDIDVLCATLSAYRLPVPEFSYVCTILLSQQVWPEAPAYNLQAIANWLGITFRHHHAEEDAAACARVALAAIHRANALSISDLCRIVSVRLGRVDSIGYAPCGVSANTLARAPVAYSRLHTAYTSKGLGRENVGLRFIVRGSTGNRYEITAAETKAAFRVRCNCAGGRHLHRCRHVKALLEGDITDLLSDNASDVVILKRMVEAFGDGLSNRNNRNRKQVRKSEHASARNSAPHWVHLS